MNHHAFAALLLAIVAPFAAGCSSTDTTSCADCGGCGIAGPSSDPGHEIDIALQGVDAAGTAALDLQLQEGMCKGQDVDAFRLLWSAGAVTVVPAGSLAKLDASKVQFNNDTYTWSDRDLTMSFTRSASDVLFTFTEAKKSTVVKCSGAARKITCAAM